MNIGQAEVAAGMTESKLLVVEAEHPKEGRVQVVDVHFLIDCREAKFVRGPVHVSAAGATAGEPDGKTMVIVVATIDLSGI